MYFKRGDIGMAKDTFSEGIAPGGLRDRADIKLLVCYLLIFVYLDVNPLLYYYLSMQIFLLKKFKNQHPFEHKKGCFYVIRY